MCNQLEEDGFVESRVGGGGLPQLVDSHGACMHVKVDIVNYLHEVHSSAVMTEVTESVDVGEKLVNVRLSGGEQLLSEEGNEVSVISGVFSSQNLP